MEIDQWRRHSRHRTQVVADRGQWIGLADENGEPIMDLPPVIEMSAPKTRNEPASLKLVVQVKSPSGIVHPVVNELIADGIGRVDAQGRLIPVNDRTRFVVVQRGAFMRRTYWVAFVVATGGIDAPSQLEIHAVDVLKILSRFPAMSAPTTWTGQWARFTRDWVGPENLGVQFKKPRDLCGMTMVTAADGATIEGPAETVIRRLVTESLVAAYRVAGITSDFPVQVAKRSSGNVSPHVLIRPTDKSILEEITPIAAAAGVSIGARMWWPSDPPEWTLSLTKPTIIITINQEPGYAPTS